MNRGQRSQCQDLKKFLSSEKISNIKNLKSQLMRLPEFCNYLKIMENVRRL